MLLSKNTLGIGLAAALAACGSESRQAERVAPDATDVAPAPRVPGDAGQRPPKPAAEREVPAVAKPVAEPKREPAAPNRQAAPEPARAKAKPAPAPAPIVEAKPAAKRAEAACLPEHRALGHC